MGEDKQVGIKRMIYAVLAVGMMALPAAASRAAESNATAAATGTPSHAKAASGSHAARRHARHRDQPSSRRSNVARAEPASSSMGHLYGLQKTGDALDLKSSVALVVDQDTNEVLLSKNPQAVLPIASITKLMTAVVVTEAGLPMDEPLTVTQDDVDATAGNRSRLQLGTTLSRGEMLHLALMSSENRAAHVLGRTYPGGLQTFVERMNDKAHELGMSDTHYVEPTGLSSSNQSSAEDLTRLVRAAYSYSNIRELSTSTEAVVPVGRHQVEFRSTNGLLRSPQWDIGLQKTGYINAAGHCLIMQAQMAGRNLIMVLLDSAGKYSRFGDAERIRKWLASSSALLRSDSSQPR